MTIFLAGATEPIGLSIMEVALKNGLNVCGVTIEKDYIPPKGAEIYRIESYEDMAAISMHAENCKPDVIINTSFVVYYVPAISTRIMNAKKRLLTNLMPTHLAMLSKKLSSRFIQFTSSYLHDGKEEIYHAETDPHAQTPLAERAVEIERQLRQAIPDLLTLLRHPLCLGNSLQGTITLHERLFFGWAHGQYPIVTNDVQRQIICTHTLAEVVIEMLGRNDTIGTFNWTGKNIMSPLEVCSMIRDHFNLTEEQAPIGEVSSNDLPLGSLDRIKSLVLDPEPLASMLKAKPPSFAEELHTLKVPEPFKEWYHSVRQ